MSLRYLFLWALCLNQQLAETMESKTTYARDCSTKKYTRQCVSRTKQEQQTRNEISTRNNEMVHLIRHHNRKKSGMADGLITALNYLTGIMDANDADAEIYSILQNLDTNIKKNYRN